MPTEQSIAKRRLRQISVSPKCDRQFGRAIHVFSWKLPPYSTDSRRYSIFWLMRKWIDPEWDSLRARFSGLSVPQMDFAWLEVQEENRLLGPCGGKIHGSYVLSEIARHHGFQVFGSFIQRLARRCARRVNSPPLECFDALIELKFACQAKLSERKMPTAKDAHKTINARRAHLKPTCRFCGQATELQSHLNGALLSAGHNNIESRPRLSAQYCQLHKPKDPFDTAVRKEYQKAKRRQPKFDVEFGRLERQILGGPHAQWAKSSNRWVDEFIQVLVKHRLKKAIFCDPKLRDEAQLLVKEKMSDTKKELVMHLAHGLTQSEAAKRLGISRQAVFKTLPLIHKNFRFDLANKNAVEGSAYPPPKSILI